MSANVLSSRLLNRNLSPAQQEILQSGLLTMGFNCILQMPTGSGKTWLAEKAIAQILAQNKRVIYLTPLRALADELHVRWQDYFAPKQVGVFTGDYTNTTKAIPYQDAQLLVMTPEKLDACTRNWRSHWSWIPEVDLVIADEFHLLGDSQRGPRLEGTLLRLLRLNPFVRVIGLSATLGNRQELANWLQGVEYHSTQRPVPLEWKTVRYKRAQDKPELLIRELQRNLASGGKSLIFVQSRRRAECLASLLTDIGLRVAHHHAGLDHLTRRKTEIEFRGSGLDVLVATATLEMGLNLPARQVILYDLQGFDGKDFHPLPVNNVWQRAGRAGRPGLDVVGEVILLAPAWDDWVDNYPKAKFETIFSGLRQPRAVAEQVIVEIASRLCKTETHLLKFFGKTLAAKQGVLAPVRQVVAEMLEAEMLVGREVDGQVDLRATKLGFVATRHLLSPHTVLLFKRILQTYSNLNFLDLLILAASSEDCQPLIPVDFEQLDELAEALSYEPSLLLELPRHDLRKLLGIDGKRLLATIHTALIARFWTRLGNVNQVADVRGCYAFEVDCLKESMQRLLLAMGAVFGALELEPYSDPDVIPVSERIRALERMIGSGLDEAAATLTLIDGIGAKLAQRLRQIGVSDIEDLALAEEAAIAQVPGISQKRAAQWIEKAGEIVDSRTSAYRYREEPIQRQFTPLNVPSDIDLYRLRRALELRVATSDRFQYQVKGGLDPHVVLWRGATYCCDCADFSKGNVCKHILAVRLYRGDQDLQRLAQVMAANSEYQGLNLLQLWMAPSSIQAF